MSDLPVGFAFDPVSGTFYNQLEGLRPAAQQPQAAAAPVVPTAQPAGPGLQSSGLPAAGTQWSSVPGYGGIDPVMMQFLAKYGITPGASGVNVGQNIFDIPGTTFNPGQATQKGIFS